MSGATTSRKQALFIGSSLRADLFSNRFSVSLTRYADTGDETLMSAGGRPRAGMINFAPRSADSPSPAVK